MEVTMKEIKELHKKLKCTEKKLEAEKNRYEELYNLLSTIIDNIPDYVWAKDQAGRYILVNKAFQEDILERLDISDVEGCTFTDLIKIAGLKQDKDNTLVTECVTNDEILLKYQKKGLFVEKGTLNGEYMAIVAHKSILKNKEGKVVGTVGTGRDVTKEYKIAKDLIAYLDDVIERCPQTCEKYEMQMETAAKLKGFIRRLLQNGTLYGA
jgi:PAS domain S-box-containing protein